MAGLSDFITNTANQTTTMPTWYDQAQQNIVTMAGTGARDMPSLQNTVAGQAITNLQGPQNPFTQGQGTLGQIGSGAANPWLVSSTGQVTPNTGTAMGGLFQAQNQQLQQMLPDITAVPTAQSIGTGQFGSLRGMTARDKAIGDAQSQLFAQQMDAALRNQQTGVSAATGLGNIGQQGTQAMTALGQAQQSDPFTAAANYGKIVGGIQAPTTVANRTQLSPLNTIGSLASAGSGVLDTLFGKSKTPGGGIISNAGIMEYLKGLQIPSGGGGIQYNPDGSVINSTVPDDYSSTTGSDPGYTDLY